jgi:DNA helicase HerA-like ATPase
VILPHDGVCLVVGIRGSGKSTWAREHLIAEVESALIFDPHGEHASAADISLTPAELTEYLATGGDIPGVVSVNPRDLAPAPLRADFARFADICAGVAEDTLIVVEEVALLRRTPDAIDGIVTQSRHWGCPVALISQRAAAIPKTSRAQASHVVSFAQRDPDDVAALVELCGLDAQGVELYKRYQFFLWVAGAALDRSGEEKSP